MVQPARSAVSVSTLVVAALLVASLIVPAQTFANDNCDVSVDLDGGQSLALLAFALDYSGAGGTFFGDSTDPGIGPSWGSEELVCTAASGEIFTAIDDGASTLSVFMADQTAPIVGPAPLFTCAFTLAGGFPCPDADAFTVTAHQFPADPFEFPFDVAVPAATVSVAPRASVCGDGFTEGAEQCDDGNTDAGDCCSPTCTLDAASAPCDDGDVCTTSESCDGAGACVATAELQCDDGTPCTWDRCDPVAGCLSTEEPRPRCLHFSRSKVDIRNDPTKDRKDRFQLTAKRLSGDPGDPTTSTSYAVCVYDEIAGTPSLVDRIEIPTPGAWAPAGSGFDYDDKTGAVDGIQLVRVRRTHGRTRFAVKMDAGGLNATLPTPFSDERLLAQDGNVVVQLEDSAGQCWSQDYDEHPGKVSHRPDRFRGKHR